MKYGETLQQRSIPAWRNHNIDYDEIKKVIRKRTSAGNGESVSVPGRGDEKLLQFETELSDIFTQQHERINLFVKSKAGEIKRRLEHAKRQLHQLSSRKITTADRRIPIARLERYSRLENDVVRIGDEVRSLARFNATNRTAFRKLLKKARKWTRSEKLCADFQLDVLENYQSLLQLDFGALLDDYSHTLASIRSLYESRIKSKSAEQLGVLEPTANASITQQLQTAISTGAQVVFDTAIATVPLGASGDIANYFVHPEHLVELQVLLLHHVQPYSSRSRQNSLNQSPSNGSLHGRANANVPNQQDYYMLVADELDRFAKVEGAVTINEREHVAGVIPQRAKYFMRWTNDEDATLASRSGPSKIRTATLKRKHADSFFDKKPSERRGSESTSANQSLEVVQDELAKDNGVRALYKISSARQRFTGIAYGPSELTMATLDSNISVSGRGERADRDASDTFPFAVLQIRVEGEGSKELIATLDQSHLVERVRGFSLQYHALWQTCKPDNTSPPFWIPILSRDIRKLPPPAKARNDSLVPRGSGSASTTQRSTGTDSVRGLTDETTAVDTTRPSSGTPAEAAPPDQLETPPLKAFRKKRRRKYAGQSDDTPHRPSQQRYWNEYDNPEDGEAADNAYVIYIDPNERSTLDKLFESLGSIFSPRKEAREPDADPSTPGTPKDDESSSEDEESAALNPRKQRQGGYGTSTSAHRARSPATLAREHHRDTHLSLPQITNLCLAASLAILAITFILAAMSRHKYVRTVDTAIVFAIVCSLVFAGVGFVALMVQRRPGSWAALGTAAAVLLVDAVCSGGLLAWMLR